MGVWGSAVTEQHQTRLEDRASFARVAVRAHRGAADAEGTSTGDEPDEVINLLCDLMHLTIEAGADFAALLKSAEHHFLEERLLS